MRLMAAQALGRMGSRPEVLSALTRALGDGAWWVCAAAEPLGQMGPRPKVLSALTLSLGDDEGKEVRRAEAKFLGLMGPRSEALALLTRTLRDEGKYVRAAAVQALGKMAPALDRKQTRRLARTLAQRARGDDAAYEALQAVAERQAELQAQEARLKDPLCPAPPPGWVVALRRAAVAGAVVALLAAAALLGALTPPFQEALGQWVQGWLTQMTPLQIGLAVVGLTLLSGGLAALAQWLWQRRG